MYTVDVRTFFASVRSHIVHVRRHRSTFLLTPLNLNMYLGVAAPVQMSFAQLTYSHRHLDFSVADIRLIVAILT